MSSRLKARILFGNLILPFVHLFHLQKNWVSKEERKTNEGPAPEGEKRFLWGSEHRLLLLIFFILPVNWGRKPISWEVKYALWRSQLQQQGITFCSPVFYSCKDEWGALRVDRYINSSVAERDCMLLRRNNGRESHSVFSVTSTWGHRSYCSSWF